MSIDLDNVQVNQNARLNNNQNIQYGHTINYFDLFERTYYGPGRNSPGPWAKSGEDHRLGAYSASNKHDPRPFSRIVKLPGDKPSSSFVSDEEHRSIEQMLVDQNVKRIVVKDKAIQELYNDLRKICTDVTNSLGQEYMCLKTIKEEIDVQKIRFVVTSQALIRAVQNTPSNEARDRILLYFQLMDYQERIYQRLKDVPGHLRKILEDFQEAERRKSSFTIPDLAEEDGPDQKFRDVLGNVKSLLDEFYTLAKSLVKQPALMEEPEEVERLYVEGLAAATLFHCLSQACPVDGHRSHTVYLGLSADDTAVHETHMAIQSRATSQNSVWFRVHSTVDAITPTEAISGVTMQASESSNHKQKIPSDALVSPGPPPEARKTSCGQVSNHERGDNLAIASGLSRRAMDQFQVCPEYITQGEDPTLVVMRMVGAPNEWHNIYFLESKQRPPAGDLPVKLANIFGGRGHEHCYDFSWRVRVARLVAEAVLRIQHPLSPCNWYEKDVVFYAVEANGDNLKPFLKVEVERQENETHPNTMAAGRPGRWLLNLALILLQLGLSQRIEVPPDGRYREHILRHVEKAKDRSLEKYLAVVRNCVEFGSGGDDDSVNVDEHSFHKRYYQLIIFPLKMIENDIEPPEW